MSHDAIDSATRRIPLTDVPALPRMPRRQGHKKIDVRSVRRWAARGVNGVVLRTELVGGMRCTTEAWLSEFIERRTLAAMPATPIISVSSDKHRRDHLAAMRELDAAGI